MAMVKQGPSQTAGRLEAVSEEELKAQLEMLPDAGAVSAVVSQLEPDDLREFAASIMNVAVDHAQKKSTDIEAIRLLNGWFASMEETIAAGDELEEILSRRRSSANPSGR
jgi:hypothetical protein